MTAATRSPASAYPVVLLWRRLDIEGLERLELDIRPGAVTATSTLLSAEAGGLRLDYVWHLDPDWRTTRLLVERRTAARDARLQIERAGPRWLVNGADRPDLDGADEPDISATPFCNTLPIRRLSKQPGATLPLQTCYVDAASMTVVRSSQRYERLGPDRVRYLDLGTAAGFEAVLQVDPDDLVIAYQHLFERIPIARS